MRNSIISKTMTSIVGSICLILSCSTEKLRAAMRVLLFLLAFALISTCVSPSISNAQTSGVINNEYPIKGVYIYHFSNYITWPVTTFKRPGAPFVIGVFKDNPFGSTLDKIAKSKKVKKRKIEIRHFKSIDEVQGCHIVFVPSSVPLQTQLDLLKSLKKSPVLCMGESPEFLQRGGCVQFFIENNKVRFAINKNVIKGGKLKISAQLLALAKNAPGN